MDKLSNDINIWNNINKNIDKVNTILKKLKNHKNSIETNILENIEKNELCNTKLKYDNYYFIYNLNKTLPPLTLKILETILKNNVNDELKIKILNDIQKYRENNKNKSITLKKKNFKKSKCNSLKK